MHSRSDRHAEYEMPPQNLENCAMLMYHPKACCINARVFFNVKIYLYTDLNDSIVQEQGTNAIKSPSPDLSPILRLDAIVLYSQLLHPR